MMNNPPITRNELNKTWAFRNELSPRRRNQQFIKELSLITAKPACINRDIVDEVFLIPKHTMNALSEALSYCGPLADPDMRSLPGC